MTEEDLELQRIRQRMLRELMASAGRKMPEGVTPVTDAEFDDMVGKYPMVVVDFWAPWCAPCRMVAPVMEKLARKYAGRIAFLKMNTDENPRTPARFAIMSIPTIMVFVRGRPVDRIVGAYPEQIIDARLRRHLQALEEQTE